MANCILTVLSESNKARLMDIKARLEDICGKSSEAIKGSHRFFAAVEKGWFCAAQQMIESVGRDLNDFSHHLNRFKEVVNRDEVNLPSLSDIVADLRQIGQEFEEFNFDLAEKTISVTTKPIVLEDIALGAFEIKLELKDLKKLCSQRPYRVIALDPNPAATNDEVTHPHVSNEQLCEGDGHTAISRALEQGRFCDFFTMVVGILENYNSDSPHVAISDWEGRGCYDCGGSVSSDESYYCEYCENDYCAHCSTCCQRCETTICLGCAYECPECGEPVCSRCTASCKECGGKFCRDCLNDGLCQSCEEQRKEDEYEEESQSEPIPSIQSHSVV